MGYFRSIRSDRLTGYNLLVLFWVMLIPVPGAAREFATANPYKVEAAFLRHFAHYVTWPSGVFGDVNSPWRIGVLGQDPFGDLLENTFRGRTEQGRSFAVYRADTLDQLPACQIVFVAYDDPVRCRAALNQLRDQPVLTVGEGPDFLQDGGIIRFQVRDQVNMSINLDQARRVSLAIQTKMLEVASEVIVDGIATRAR